MTINSKQDDLFSMESLIKSDSGLHTQKQPLQAPGLQVIT